MFSYKNTSYKKETSVPYSNELGVGTFRSEFDNLVDKLFDSFWESPSFVTDRNWRPTRIDETKDSIKIEIELPRFTKEQIKVEVEDNQLKVSAKNDRTSYVRSFAFKNGLDYDKTNVKLENGVLFIDIPKLPNFKAKSIEVK